MSRALRRCSHLYRVFSDQSPDVGDVERGAEQSMAMLVSESGAPRMS